MSTPEQQRARRRREPEKVRARDRAWAHRNAEKVKIKNASVYQTSGRKHLLKKKYGMTLEQYDALLAQQKGVCAVCGDPPGARALHVDHCHASGLVRGLLCVGCNMALGALKEDPLRMRALEAYIRQFNWIKT